MESSKFRAPVLHDILVLGATGRPMFITMLGDKLMHGSGHVRIQRLFGSALARLDDQLEMRVNRIVSRLYNLKLVCEVDGLGIIEGVISSSFGASDPTSRCVRRAAETVGFRPDVDPASVSEELNKGFEMLGVPVNVPQDAGRPQRLAVYFINGTLEGAIGTPGEASVLWTS